MAGDLRERVLAAYGGEARWRAATAVDTTVSVGGPLVLLKRGRGFRNLHVRTEIAHARARLQPIDRRGRAGVLDGHSVRLETADGRLLESRAEARSKFHGRRMLWWDALDMVYFFGYAMWNYLAFPALLLRDDIEWRELSEHTLEGRFPPHLPTHCPIQRFHFDPATGLLRRHDYTAEVFGQWAVAAHLVLKHETADGLPFPAKRRVVPRGKPFAPVFIWLDLHRWSLV
jgi:hypothetical protein